MTSQTETAAAAVIAIGSTMVGNSIAIAEAIIDPLPYWVQPLMGPAGTVLCLVIALRWLTGRLDRNERKFDEMDSERRADRERMLELMGHNIEAIREMTRIVSGCPQNRPPSLDAESRR